MPCAAPALTCRAHSLAYIESPTKQASFVQLPDMHSIKGFVGLSAACSIGYSGLAVRIWLDSYQVLMLVKATCCKTHNKLRGGVQCYCTILCLARAKQCQVQSGPHQTHAQCRSPALSLLLHLHHWNSQADCHDICSTLIPEPLNISTNNSATALCACRWAAP